jgi:apolipoprotein N-acyltransferase
VREAKTSRAAGGRRVVGALASGVMLAALFPKIALSPLAWVALVPLILVARAAPRPRAAAVYGLLTGVLFFAVLVEWIRLFDPTGTAWVVATLLEAAFVALFAALVRALSPSPRGWRGVLVPAAAWTATEWLRALGPLGFTWGGLAYSQHANLALAQVVSLVGTGGLTFLIALVNAALAAVLAEGARDRRQGVLRLGVAVALVLAGWGWGRWRLAQPLPEGERLRVALIQGNLGDEGDRHTPVRPDHAPVYLRLTEAAAQRGAQLVIWPESAIPGALLVNPALADTRAAIAQAARRHRLNVVVGSAHVEEGRSLNATFLFNREGHVAGRYDKVHLVPYGEYTPFRRQLDFLYRHFPVIDHEFSSGRGFFPLPADTGPLGMAICFESAFPSITRALRREGADLLAVVTNDAWFGRRSATWQHYHMARFRAIESGTYLVRAATTGFTAVLDPCGRVVQEAPLFHRTLLVADVARLPRPTLYTRLGDVVAWACALAILGLLVAWRRQRPPSG